MNTRKLAKTHHGSTDISKKSDDEYSHDILRIQPSKTNRSPISKNKIPFSVEVKSNGLASNTSCVFTDHMVVLSSLKSILDHVKIYGLVPETFQILLDHVYNYAFGSMNPYTSSMAFKSQVLHTMSEFYHIIKDEPDYSQIKILHARVIVDKILGARKKVNKKRKIHIDAAEKEDTERQYDQRLFYDSVFLLMFLSMKSSDLMSYFYSEEEFMHVYGDLCQSISIVDKEAIILYRNMMKIATMIIPAFGNKGLLLDLVTKLVEGHHRKYVTGSGATIDTKRRVRIYENEGAIMVIVRPERRKIKDARILGSLHTIRPMDAIFQHPKPPTSSRLIDTKTQIVSPSVKSSGLEREAAESIASLHASSPGGGSLANELRLEESQESVVWNKAMYQFSKDVVGINRNHSLM